MLGKTSLDGALMVALKPFTKEVGAEVEGDRARQEAVPIWEDWSVTVMYVLVTVDAVGPDTKDGTPV